MAVSEDIESVSYLVPLQWYFHSYFYPFVIVYIIECLIWYTCLTSEGAFGLFILTVFFQFVLVLSCVWSVHAKAFLAYKKVYDVKDASMVKVVPTSNNGSPEIVSLQSTDVATGGSFTWFDFQKSRYIYNNCTKQFCSLKFPEDWYLNDYLSYTGFQTEVDIVCGKQKYGLNLINIELPDFVTLFIERATAPFFVFQVFCVILWCLEEYWYYSVFTLLMLIIFEAILVKQQQRNQFLIKNMSPKPYAVYAYRGKKWCKLLTDSLLPGDIISLVRYDEGYSVPCDVLLLHGQCIVDEALLTGESVPQMKEPISSLPCDKSLSLETDAKVHVLSGGTKIAQHIPASDLPSCLKGAPDNGCIGFVLRTGYSTSQGRLLRTILYSVKRVTANNLESFLFIAFLLMFAIAASLYVWVRGAEDPNQNTYKLLLECILIITSVVPPELPVELSLAVNSSLARLVKADIFCTEPFRIPFAGKIDVCCFDKTGTLTSDSFDVHGVAGSSVSHPEDIISPDKLSIKPTLVLASCHSLVQVDGTLVGDPIEVASLNAINWKLTKNDFLCSKKDRKLSLKIVRRFHFTSSLKRMCVICTQNMGGTDMKNTYICTVKGAAEVLLSMFQDPPAHYQDLYTSLSASGYRVLALGYKSLGSLSSSQVKTMHRDDIECGLEFAGFVVTSSPINKGSLKCIRSVISSSHKAVMITGDSPLTACHVAQDLVMSPKDILVLTESDKVWSWRNTTGTTVQMFDPSAEAIKSIGKLHDLCLTGEGLDFLVKNHKHAYNHLLPHVKVFARVTPKQKQHVITSYKDKGMYALMCGDGTNDVGALKHAHVGVSLLKHAKRRATNAALPPADEKRVEHAAIKPNVLQRRSLHRRHKDIACNVHSSEKRDRRLLLENQLYGEEEGPVKLGDASIASPFTYKGSSVVCVLQILKQGRCTLVTTLQMLKILALNALILAYSQSVLYIHGIKFSDTQYTLQGILLAACFLFVSQSKVG
jgi:cation-transporting ATPase 13A1